MTVLEIEFGLLTIPESRLREALTAAFTQVLDKMIDLASLRQRRGHSRRKTHGGEKTWWPSRDLRDHDCRHRDLYRCDARYNVTFLISTVCRPARFNPWQT